MQVWGCCFTLKSGNKDKEGSETGMRKQSLKRKFPIKTKSSLTSYQPMDPTFIQEGTVRISSFPGLDFKKNVHSYLKAMSDFIRIRILGSRLWRPLSDANWIIGNHLSEVLTPFEGSNRRKHQ